MTYCGAPFLGPTMSSSSNPLAGIIATLVSGLHDIESTKLAMCELKRFLTINPYLPIIEVSSFTIIVYDFSKASKVTFSDDELRRWWFCCSMYVRQGSECNLGECVSVV